MESINSSSSSIFNIDRSITSIPKSKSSTLVNPKTSTKKPALKGSSKLTESKATTMGKDFCENDALSLDPLELLRFILDLLRKRGRKEPSKEFISKYGDCLKRSLTSEVIKHKHTRQLLEQEEGKLALADRKIEELEEQIRLLHTEKDAQLRQDTQEMDDALNQQHDKPFFPQISIDTLEQQPITTLTAAVFKTLGALPHSFHTFSKNNIQELVDHLHVYYQGFLNKYDTLDKQLRRLLEENRNLLLEMQETRHTLELRRAQDAERQKITDTLQEIVATIPKASVASPSTAERTTSIPTYAEKTRQLFRAEGPTIQVVSKEESLTPQDIQKRLNTLPQENLPPVLCRTTREGRILVTCTNSSDLEQIKATFQSTEILKDVVEVTDLRPRRGKVILFGAPEAPPKPTKDDDESVSKAFEDYITQILDPAIKKYVGNGNLDYEVVRILKGRPGSIHNHLVLSIPEQLAQTLIGQTISVAFNRCTIRRYVAILRCFKCQRIGHATRTCSSAPRCVTCASRHISEQCKNPSDMRCVNCHEAQINKNGPRDSRVNIKHAASDPKCPTYRKALQDAIAKTRPPRKETRK